MNTTLTTHAAILALLAATTRKSRRVAPRKALEVDERASAKMESKAAASVGIMGIEIGAEL